MKKRLLVSWEGSEGGADLVKTAKRLIKSQVIKWQRPVQGEGVKFLYIQYEVQLTDTPIFVIFRKMSVN